MYIAADEHHVFALYRGQEAIPKEILVVVPALIVARGHGRACNDQERSRAARELLEQPLLLRRT